MQLFDILHLLGAVFSVALAAIVLSGKPRRLPSMGFALGMMNLSIIETGHALTFTASRAGLFGQLSAHLIIFGQAALPSTWLFFAMVFGNAGDKKIVKHIPFLAVVFAIGLYLLTRLAFSGFAPIIINDGVTVPDAVRSALGPAWRYFHIYMILGLIAPIALLWRTYSLSRAEERRRMRYLLLGTGAILSLFIYSAAGALIFSRPAVLSMEASSVVILLSAAVMAVAIIQHSLMGVDIFISRYVAYNLLIALTAGFYLLAAGAITVIISRFDAHLNHFFTGFFVLVSAVLLFTFFSNTTFKRKLKFFVIRHFYRNKYEFRDKWMETIEKISSVRSIGEVEKALVEMITNTMGAKNVKLWLYNQALDCFVSSGVGQGERFREIELKHPVIGLIRERGEPFAINGVNAGAGGGSSPVIASLLTAANAALCAPLLIDKELMGFILQDRDRSGEPYGQHDFELIKALTTHAAVQIQHIRLAQELMEAKEVEAFHRLSAFVMHDLKNLTNSLSLVSQNFNHNMENPEFRRDAVKAVDSTVTMMKGLIERLSTLPKGLVINKVECNLNSLVRSVIKRVPMSGKEVIISNGIESVFPVSVDQEAMGMVFLNMFINAFEAVGADGRITVSASKNGDTADITIADNGAGIPYEFIEKDLFKPFKTTKRNGLGIGLFQCKAIVEAHGGRIAVKSEPGQGTTFKIVLPVVKAS